MDMVAQLRDLEQRLTALEQGATPVAIEPPEGAFVTREEYDNSMILIHGLINAVDELQFDLNAARARLTLIEDEIDRAHIDIDIDIVEMAKATDGEPADPLVVDPLVEEGPVPPEVFGAHVKEDA
ncbi:MAG: hypothetical protein AB7R40_23165 [Nitrospiraceae bacterium]